MNHMKTSVCMDLSVLFCGRSLQSHRFSHRHIVVCILSDVFGSFGFVIIFHAHKQ